ncbi:MAG: His/Gly/Thr/Pro-type tRNA ligase C-terminal domain-containing protein [Patescibacteria group bacterium]|nr:His/Gly/Thr/Pro-type tRNA ligase C-terminal domain-containing protein [Patescibacteria group bacterium]
MKQSDLFTKTTKNSPKDEEALNARLLVRGGFVQKLMAGVYSFLPLGLRVIRNIEKIVREEMVVIGGEEISLPVLHPKANWVQTGRWDAYDTLFRFTSHYSKNEYVLGPTHEEVIAPLAKQFIFSYQDLPKYLFQIQTKFRDEKRAKSGLLRGREFLMKDLYSFHQDDADLDAYYEKVQGAYQSVFARVGLGEDTVLTFASGGSFSQYSHEFQTLLPSGEDTVYLCEKCRVAVNKEIIKEQSACPSCGNTDLQERMGAEVGNIFKLKTKYSAPFELRYRNEKGEMHEILMGCYGIGISRLMGVIVERFHDDKGIIWPESVAPFRVHLLELNSASAKDLYNALQEKGVDVLYDDTDRSAGEKFADADLLGIPLRAVISPKTDGNVEVKSRASDTTEVVSHEELIRRLVS